MNELLSVFMSFLFRGGSEINYLDYVYTRSLRWPPPPPQVVSFPTKDDHVRNDSIFHKLFSYPFLPLIITSSNGIRKKKARFQESLSWFLCFVGGKYFCLFLMCFKVPACFHHSICLLLQLGHTKIWYLSPHFHDSCQNIPTFSFIIDLL